MSNDRLHALENLVMALVECLVYEKKYSRKEILDYFDRLMEDHKAARASETGWK